MDQRIPVIVVLALIVGTVTGTVSAVPVEAFPQQVTQSDQEVTSGKKVSIDRRSTVYSGADIHGYDVTVRNDESTKLTVNVTVRLLTLDGTVVATESGETIVLTGTSDTVEIRFDPVVESSAFDRVEVEAAAS